MKKTVILVLLLSLLLSCKKKAEAQTEQSLITSIALLLFTATGKPQGVEPVQNFQLEKYLGKWYEIARFDHSFERGLSHVTAEYSVIDTANVKVLNKGYNEAKNTYETREGTAMFAADASTGHLKVSFFGPFYSSYIIIELDADYQYSLVTGPDRNYLWILARNPTLDSATLNKLLDKAKSLNYNTDNLIYVNQK